MRIYILFFVMLLISIVEGFSQNLDSLGMDNAPSLNKVESAYFNQLFKASKGDFNFENANLIFATGPSGKKIVSKKEYFNKLVKPWLSRGNTPQTFYKLLSAGEKLKSGKYDVIVLSWVKVFKKRTQKRIIRKIKKKSA